MSHADDLVILVDGFHKWDWLAEAAYTRLLEELAKLDVQVNTEKTRIVDLTRGTAFSFLGFDVRRMKTRRGEWGVSLTPRMKARTALLRKLKAVFRSHISQPIEWVIDQPHPARVGELLSDWILQ